MDQDRRFSFIFACVFSRQPPILYPLFRLVLPYFTREWLGRQRGLISSFWVFIISFSPARCQFAKNLPCPHLLPKSYQKIILYPYRLAF